MKQEQIAAFCHRQREAGRAAVALWMPGPEIMELVKEVIGDGSEATFPDGLQPGAVQCGVTISEYLNPATGAVMPLGLMPEGGEPMASVRIGEGANTFLVPVG